MDEAEKAARDKLRSDGVAPLVETDIVEHRGNKYEVRAPSITAFNAYKRLATDKKSKEVDGTKLAVLCVIGCTYVPGTDTKVFEKADETELMAQSVSPRSTVGVLGKRIIELTRMSKKAQKAVEKDFGAAPTSS